MKKLLLVFAVTPLALAGCETSAPQAQAPVMAAPMMDESVPQVARQACLNKVASVTSATQVTIGEMVYSEAGSQIKVLVGPQKAAWQCTVANSGIGPQVMSLTNEGAM